jgi:hypothetical protein
MVGCGLNPGLVIFFAARGPPAGTTRGDPMGDKQVLALLSTVTEVRPSRSMISDPVERAAVTAALNDAFGFAGRRVDWMPAPQPVSLDAEGLKVLGQRRDEYMCALKADGARFLLVMLMVGAAPLAVMVSRKMEMYEMSIAAQPEHYGGVHCVDPAALAGTVVDGELVAHEGGLRYLVFDALVVKGRHLRDQELIERMLAVYRHFEVYNLKAGASMAEVEAAVEAQDKVLPLAADTPMQIVPKRWWVVQEVGRMWAERRQLGAGVDGVVFMRRFGVVAGTDRTMYKWKSSHTVDLGLTADAVLVAVDGQLAPVEDALAAYSGQGRKRCRAVTVELLRNELVEVLLGNRADAAVPIVECELRVDGDHVALWPVLERYDKVLPNDVGTVALTISGVRDQIDITRLAATCEGGEEGRAMHMRARRRDAE